jgi:hypothetical protein
MYGRILIALEGKETDKTVVTHVERLAGQMHPEVTLLRAITVADDDGGTRVARQWQLEVGSNGWRRKNQGDQRLLRRAA